MSVAIVVVGASLGGPAALRKLLADLPRRLRPPIAIVQHRGKTSGHSLARFMGQSAGFPVVEPNDKEPLEAGCVYLAPADYHLLIEIGSLALSTEAPVNHVRPSIDVLFESAAAAYGSGVVGVILTGSGWDGASGCARIKECGGVVLVQAVKDADCGDMPKAAIAAAKVDRILPLSRIAAALCEICV